MMEAAEGNVDTSGCYMAATLQKRKDDACGVHFNS